MPFATLLLLNLLFWMQATCKDVVVTQSPQSLSLPIGATTKIKCRTNVDVDDDMNWYQQKPDEAPKALFSKGNTRASGVPERFNSSGNGRYFTLHIHDLEAEDEGIYYCQQSHWYPYTFGQGTNLEIIEREDATPSVLIFPPSQEQLKTSSATVVCLINNFYPSDLKVAWKVDGKAATGDIQTSSAATHTNQTYTMSSTLTMSTEEYNSHYLYACEVTHKTLSQPLVKSLRRSECPPEVSP